MSDLGDLGFLTDILAAASSYWLSFALYGLFFVVALYFIHCYIIMSIGRKAGLKEDFMPFIPIASEIYQMKIADAPVWYIFFFQGTLITTLVGIGLPALLGAIIKNVVIPTIISIAYKVACIVFTFLYYQKFYERFGFNRNTAWVRIIPSFGIVGTVLDVFVAFSNTILFTANKAGKSGAAPARKGVIFGVSGTYANATFDIADGQELTFGRDPQSVNIVLSQTDADVSRRHLSIKFDARTNQYIITDLGSKTGSFLENGTALEANKPVSVAKGSVVYIGSTRKNGFRLN